MFERPNIGERALLVNVKKGTLPRLDLYEEFKSLAISAGAEVVAFNFSSRDKACPKYFIGLGKLEEIKQQIISENVNLILFNNTLSPGQEKNLEKALGCRVIDRTGLILDIFAQRARTFEGKLQVELAQLTHMSTRLIRGWTHLERQKGGIGLRGPGEKQLETDRRLIRQRMKALKNKLAKVRSQREQSSAIRRKAHTPVIALVGYTNAGKSTLFNTLTKANVLVQDQLFATLDPTFRQTNIPFLGEVVFVDTVGFVSDLPHDLVESFHATLEETRLADLLLHIIDASDPSFNEKVLEVEKVLKQIGAEHIPQIIVLNKIDLLKQPLSLDSMTIADKAVAIVNISAIKNDGLDNLYQSFRNYWQDDLICAKLKLPPSASALRSDLFKANAILKESTSEEGDFLLQISIFAHELKSICNLRAINWRNYVISQ